VAERVRVREIDDDEGRRVVRIVRRDSGSVVTPTGSDLHWYHVQHCVGLVGNGDPAALSAVYAISPAQTITSP
jgi:hypothetical protein